MERLARFRREAEVLALLNPPNIAAIYGLERSGGGLTLVKGYFQGPHSAANTSRCVRNMNTNFGQTSESVDVRSFRNGEANVAAAQGQSWDSRATLHQRLKVRSGPRLALTCGTSVGRPRSSQALYRSRCRSVMNAPP
jgi:hypothetical protein